MFKIRVHEVKHSLLTGGINDKIKTWVAQGHQRVIELRKCCPRDKSDIHSRYPNLFPVQFQLKECLRNKCQYLEECT